MTYQFLALDLDGTTLQNDHTLNPAVKSYVQKIKHDYPVMIVTGRHHTAAKPYYDELELTTPIICCNGVYRYDYSSQQPQSSMPIPHDFAQQFLNLAHSFKLQLVMYTADGMAFSQKDPISYMLPLYAWAQSYPVKNRPNIYQVSSFEQELKQTEYIWKFVVQGEEERFTAFLQLPFIQQYFSGSMSGPNRIDLAMKGHSKGNALSHYLQIVKVNAQQVVAAGDNYNDISMLQSAGCGIAMHHAHQEVKQHANIICSTDNHGEGLSQLLHQYFPL
ncbi:MULTISPECIES: Cof-type HAD-IIB family hydrolase [Vibrio]|uniref:Cof-type HAD-IIB family hydrolase n=1 Tax=Vibrio casei TaxID=673372 RepID=A0A368LJC4_9VIBR|nr:MULTISPECIES: Cof-type HAD-IIB family hydrolase [Vibrio]RCS70453.1 Cof-type HAD-IIB family hydrolase [Vibrio casei]SJN28290.1 HMP-PP hydrolase (pyridoxal phosphatase) Cof, detected in genetic screen for thiamin metabolic genes (PMID:15292217) [Vibrio casei]HBV76997.1 Cof-type HAD-IIB family hydrolase [Vibrio sp.]